jgi:hypothetical protein
MAIASNLKETTMQTHRSDWRRFYRFRMAFEGLNHAGVTDEF